MIGRALSALLVVLALSAFAPRAIATEMKWSAATPMPLARSELSATVVEDRLYVAGGIAQLGASPAFQVYDPSANSWRSLAPLPEPRHHLGMASLDGRIYVSGGYRDLPFGADQAHRETWSYDVTRDRWSRTADLPVRRAAHAMVALGDRLYVVGGVGPEPETVLVYDRRLDSWSRLPAPLPTPREHLACLALDGKLYVVGGRWSGQGNFGTVEIYDAATNVWSQAADMPTARGGLTAAVVGGRIHVTGGEDLDSGDTFPAHEVYEPAANRWSVAAPLPTSRHGLASGVIDERWYVVGGGEQAGAMTFVSLSNVVEVFGP